MIPPSFLWKSSMPFVVLSIKTMLNAEVASQHMCGNLLSALACFSTIFPAPWPLSLLVFPSASVPLCSCIPLLAVNRSFGPLLLNLFAQNGREVSLILPALVQTRQCFPPLFPSLFLLCALRIQLIENANCVWIGLVAAGNWRSLETFHSISGFGAEFRLNFQR